MQQNPLLSACESPYLDGTIVVTVAKSGGNPGQPKILSNLSKAIVMRLECSYLLT